MCVNVSLDVAHELDVRQCAISFSNVGFVSCSSVVLILFHSVMLSNACSRLLALCRALLVA